MSELLNSKCRYLAELKVFEDFHAECKSNTDFIDFIHTTLSQASYLITKEVESRSFEKDLLKSPLSRQIREQLLIFAQSLNTNTIQTINELLNNPKKQLVLLKERTKGIIQSTKEFLESSQAYFAFYKGKLNSNTQQIDYVSTTIKKLNRQQLVKTKELQGRGKSIDKIQIDMYCSKKQVLSLQISNLEKCNKRFRSDVHIENERLGNSYQHLTNILIKQLKQSETKMVDSVSKLLYSMEIFMKPIRNNGSIIDQAHFEEINFITKQVEKQNFDSKNIVFEPPKELPNQSLCLPTFPGKESKYIGQLDSLFFSKSIDQ